MIKPLWAAAGVALIGITSGAAVIIITSGGEEEVALQVQESATPDGSPRGTPTPELRTTVPTPTPGQSKTSLPGGYEFSYPVSWNQVLVSDNPYIAKFFLTSTPIVATEYLAELEVFVYENPQRVALEEFFNGQERPNLFKDAAGGYRPFSAGGATGYWFDNVLGLTTSTDVALSSDGFVYQLADADQKHQSDGHFLQILLSFKRVEG